jgi:hypothetical protein
VDTTRSSPWSRRLAAFGLVWGTIALIITTTADPTPKNLTLLVSILASGSYTLTLYVTRRFWLPLLAQRPLRNAILLGIVNAAMIETIFLVFEHVLGAEGVAAHPNLIIDLSITMPWYALMVYAFVNVQNRQRFPPATVLLLGAVYETGADGVVAQVAGIVFGESQLLNPSYWVLLALLAFWQFIPVYSSMVLPPTWLIETIPPSPPLPRSAWHDALRPLLWLIPFTIYALALVILLGTFNVA